MDCGNVVIKAAFGRSTIGAGKSAAFHVRYIGTRPGTDMTCTDEDMKRDAMLDQLRVLSTSDSDIYTKYIGRRPGVALSDEVNHGLFDRHGTADITEVCSQLRNLKNAQVIKLIVSLREKDAAALSIVTKSHWETLVRTTMPRIGKTLDLSPSRLGWVAAYHPKEGHPHIHLVIWDKNDQARHGYMAMTKSELAKIKNVLAAEIFSEERTLLYGIKHEERTSVRQMAKEDVAAVLSLFPSSGVTQPIKEKEAWLYTHLMSIADKLPGKGRLAYQFMDKRIKEEIDVVTNGLLKSPRFSKSVVSYINAHEAIARNYLSETDKIMHVRENALVELRERINNVILRGSFDLKNAVSHDEIRKQNATIRQMSFKGSTAYERDCLIRCKIAAGMDKDDIMNGLAEGITMGGINEAARLQVDALVEHACKKEFCYRDWEAIKDEALDKSSMQIDVRGCGIYAYRALNDILMLVSLSIPNGENDAIDNFDLSKKSKKGNFIGRRIIGEKGSENRNPFASGRG